MEKREIARVQGLAKQVREIAELPIPEKNRKLWTAVNDLRMIRPVIHVRDYPHYLIRYGDELETTVGDEFLKKIELDLLVRLYEWNHLRCDRVVEPTIKCQVVYSDSGFGIEATGGDRMDFIEGGSTTGPSTSKPRSPARRTSRRSRRLWWSTTKRRRCGATASCGRSSATSWRSGSSGGTTFAAPPWTTSSPEWESPRGWRSSPRSRS